MRFLHFPIEYCGKLQPNVATICTIEGYYLLVICRNRYTNMFEDTIGVLRSSKSKKNRQYNDQKKQDKQWSTKHYKEKKRLGNTNLTKTGGEPRCSESVSSSCFTSGTSPPILVTNLMISLNGEIRWKKTKTNIRHCRNNSKVQQKNHRKRQIRKDWGLWLRQTELIRGHWWHKTLVF